MIIVLLNIPELRLTFLTANKDTRPLEEITAGIEPLTRWNSQNHESEDRSHLKAIANQVPGVDNQKRQLYRIRGSILPA